MLLHFQEKISLGVKQVKSYEDDYRWVPFVFDLETVESFFEVNHELETRAKKLDGYEVPAEVEFSKHTAVTFASGLECKINVPFESFAKDIARLRSNANNWPVGKIHGYIQK